MCATEEGRAVAAEVLLVWACNAYAWSAGGCALLAAGALVTHRWVQGGGAAAGLLTTLPPICWHNQHCCQTLPQHNL
jgi:hypothetical protein